MLRAEGGPRAEVDPRADGRAEPGREGEGEAERLADDEPDVRCLAQAAPRAELRADDEAEDGADEPSRVERERSEALERSETLPDRSPCESLTGRVRPGRAGSLSCVGGFR